MGHFNLRTRSGNGIISVFIGESFLSEVNQGSIGSR